MGLRVGSGIFPLSTYTTTTANQEVIKPLLSSVNVTEAFSVTFIPDVSPCLISINDGAFINADLFETTANSVAISSLVIANSGTKYQLQVEY